ncbi:uncharacterized protein LOC110428932, partial [Herrania umbratica]|uniref:Uncharacterized protein LOC110428932 n=1 Tax=Herrania umbratica TaxID=108875 RepID=A0A6J1BQI5_9ROSI
MTPRVRAPGSTAPTGTENPAHTGPPPASIPSAAMAVVASSEGDTSSTGDRSPEPAGAPPRRRSPVASGWFLAGLAAVTVLLGLAIPLAPVDASDPVVTWPKAGQPATPTSLPLAPYRPLSIQADVPCDALRGGGAGLRTEPESAGSPGRGLTVAASGGRVTVASSGETLVEEILPLQPCLYRVTADGDATRIERRAARHRRARRPRAARHGPPRRPVRLDAVDAQAGPARRAPRGPGRDGRAGLPALARPHRDGLGAGATAAPPRRPRRRGGVGAVGGDRAAAERRLVVPADGPQRNADGLHRQPDLHVQQHGEPVRAEPVRDGSVGPPGQRDRHGRLGPAVDAAAAVAAGPAHLVAAALPARDLAGPDRPVDVGGVVAAGRVPRVVAALRAGPAPRGVHRAARGRGDAAGRARPSPRGRRPAGAGHRAGRGRGLDLAVGARRRRSGRRGPALAVALAGRPRLAVAPGRGRRRDRRGHDRDPDRLRRRHPRRRPRDHRCPQLVLPHLPLVRGVGPLPDDDRDRFVGQAPAGAADRRAARRGRDRQRAPRRGRGPAPAGCAQHRRDDRGGARPARVRPDQVGQPLRCGRRPRHRPHGPVPAAVTAAAPPRGPHHRGERRPGDRRDGARLRRRQRVEALLRPGPA